MNQRVITLKNGHCREADQPVREFAELASLEHATKVYALAGQKRSCLGRGELLGVTDLTQDLRWVAGSLYSANSLLINCEANGVSEKSVDKALEIADAFVRPSLNQQNLVIVNTIDPFLVSDEESAKSPSARARLYAAERLGEIIAKCTSAIVVATSTSEYISDSKLTSAFKSRYEIPYVPASIPAELLSPVDVSVPRAPALGALALA